MIRLGETIYNILSNDESVTDIVGAKIYPMVADVSTTFPFIVYRKASYTPTYTKDGITSKDGVFEIVIASDRYNQSVELADRVNNAFTAYRNIRLNSNSEDYIENTFIQTLTYNIYK